MGEFDKTKKAIGVEKIDEDDRKKMFDKFQSAGGKVVREKVEKQDESSKKSSGSKTEKFKAVGGGKTSSAARRYGTGGGDDEDEDGVKTKSSGTQDAEAEMGNFFNKVLIKFKCWAGKVTPFGIGDLTPSFLSEVNLEGKAAFMEFKLVSNDILANPNSPKVVKALDKISPLYVELISRAGNVFDQSELAELLEDYNFNPEKPVPIRKVIKPLQSIFKKLYYLYAYQGTYRKAVMAGYDFLQQIENKPAILYSTKKKKINAEISVAFEKLFPKFYLAVIRHENKNIPMISLYMENLLGITDDEKLGKRKSGEDVIENKPPVQEETKEEEQAKEEKKPEKEENKELAFGMKLMSDIPLDQLRKKYDQKNELVEMVDIDKCLLAYLYYKEFEYEYSFILTTKKINFQASTVNGTKVDHKMKLSQIYELSRPCQDQFRIYLDVYREYYKYKTNPGTNYIEASKRLTQLEQKRGQQSRNVRVAIKDYMEKTLDEFELFIEDMKGIHEIVTNMDETIVFDSVEAKKRLHRKQVKQCIMEAYCYTLAFATRLSNAEGDLYGGMVELTPEQVKGTSAKGSGTAEQPTIGASTEQDISIGDVL